MSKEAFGISMETEIWKPVNIEGYRDTHEASNYGRVRSLDRMVNGKNGSTRTIKGAMLPVRPDNMIILKANKHQLAIRPVDIIGYTFIPNYHKYMNITYVDGNVNNVRLDNILTCSTNGITLRTTSNNQIIDGIPVIEGGFAEGGRVLFDITIASKIGKLLGHFRRDNIIPNLHNWEKGVDYLNLMEYNNFTDFIPMLLELGYTEATIIQSDHIFIFSERGVPKVMATLRNSNPVKWEFLNNFVNEYFGMREQIKNQQNTLEQQKKDLLFAIYTGGQAGIIASKQLTELEVAEATAPLIETIEEQKPKVEKYKEYVDSDGYIAPRQAAQILKLSHATAQAFNKLLKEHGIQYKSGKNWVLYTEFEWMLEKDYCKQVPYIDSNGTVHHSLRWTPKGLDYIRDNILNKP